jgi:hypothetical protein
MTTNAAFLKTLTVLVPKRREDVDEGAGAYQGEVQRLCSGVPLKAEVAREHKDEDRSNRLNHLNQPRLEKLVRGVGPPQVNREEEPWWFRLAAGYFENEILAPHY